MQSYKEQIRKLHQTEDPNQYIQDLAQTIFSNEKNISKLQMITNLGMERTQKFLVLLWIYISYIINQQRIYLLVKNKLMKRQKTFYHLFNLIIKNPLGRQFCIRRNDLKLFSNKRSLWAIAYIILQPVQDWLIFLYQGFINMINLWRPIIVGCSLRTCFKFTGFK